MAEKLRIVVGSDCAGIRYKEILAEQLRNDDRVAEVIDVGQDLDEDTHYPHIAVSAARLISDGRADRALLVCGTGLGMAITANKIPGVRAATAHDPYSAERARKSNDAQVLTMGARVIAPQAAEKVLDHWLASEFEGGGSAPKVEKMKEVDARFRAARAATD
jgi:ribose 5-phosphate isomerase B